MSKHGCYSVFLHINTNACVVHMVRVGAYRSVSVGLIFPLSMSARAQGPLYLVSMGPIEGLARCALV